MHLGYIATNLVDHSRLPLGPGLHSFECTAVFLAQLLGLLFLVRRLLQLEGQSFLFELKLLDLTDLLFGETFLALDHGLQLSDLVIQILDAPQHA